MDTHDTNGRGSQWALLRMMCPCLVGHVAAPTFGAVRRALAADGAEALCRQVRDAVAPSLQTYRLADPMQRASFNVSLQLNRQAGEHTPLPQSAHNSLWEAVALGVWLAETTEHAERVRRERRLDAVLPPARVSARRARL